MAETFRTIKATKNSICKYVLLSIGYDFDFLREAVYIEKSTMGGICIANTSDEGNFVSIKT